MSISTRITSNGSATTTQQQACAACKYQRRKCTPDCILAPYFPHDRQRQFLNAHKLFGVSNITKIIRNLDPPEKDEAMKTIMFQSDARANDPVGGCYRIICDLQRQIELSKAELDLVLHQLAIFRNQTSTHLQVQEPDDSVLTYNDDDLIENYQQVVHEHDHHHRFGYIQCRGGVDDDGVHAWDMPDPTMISDSDDLRFKQLQVEEINHDSTNDHRCDHDHDHHREVKPEAQAQAQAQAQLVEIPYERHEMKVENDQVEIRRRFVPSTRLLISS